MRLMFSPSLPLVSGVDCPFSVVVGGGSVVCWLSAAVVIDVLLMLLLGVFILPNSSLLALHSTAQPFSWRSTDCSSARHPLCPRVPAVHWLSEKKTLCVLDTTKPDRVSSVPAYVCGSAREKLTTRSLSSCAPEPVSTEPYTRNTTHRYRGRSLQVLSALRTTTDRHLQAVQTLRP